MLPVPAEAIRISPGFTFASAMNSFTLRAGSEGCTASMSGTSDTSEVAAKSRSGSYAGWLVNTGLTVSEPLDPSSHV
ncbi:hypothetical protein D3C83_32070 [compost metagenome]